MKVTFKIFLFNLLIVMCLKLNAQKKEIIALPVIDERIELISIVFRLAEYKEYNSTRFENYVKSIDKHFIKHKNHDLILFCKELRNKSNLGYDAVMKMAIHIGNSPDFKPLLTFNKQIPDERWGKSNALKFIKLLKQFYIDANCAEFFIKNKDLYNNSLLSFKPIFQKLDVSWYHNFYGIPQTDEFNIILALGNGGANYGVQIQDTHGLKKVYAIMGTWQTDKLGEPIYNMGDYFPILVHEFNHSFINYLTYKFSEKLKPLGEKLYKRVSEQMKKQAYNSWETMMNEALVRAAVIVYMKDHNFSDVEIEEEFTIQKNKGFFWIEDLVEGLENYKKNRSIYKELDDYMPEIIKMYQKIDNK